METIFLQFVIDIENGKESFETGNVFDSGEPHER